MVGGHAVVQEGIELAQARFEIEGLRLHRIVQRLQRLAGQRQAARRLADAQVDTARRQRGQHLEGLRDLEGAVVLQHDAAGADADARGLREQVRGQHLGCRTGVGAVAVVLGQPVAPVTQPFGAPGQRDGVLERLRGIGTFGDQALVEQGERVGHGVRRWRSGSGCASNSASHHAGRLR
ncbi:hypothetical protein D3C72_1741710 [compost metagenome]